jgi:hypothetical protein
MKKPKSIVIVTHKRADLLSNLLKSLENAAGIDEWFINLVWQTGSQEVGAVISRNQHLLDNVLQVDGSNRSTTENISRNRYLGYLSTFDWLDSEYVLGLEEDVEIAPDALKFIDFVINKHGSYSAFRGVNLGSGHRRDALNDNKYSFQRYGIHGPAAVITKSTWKKFDISELMKSAARSDLFDGHFEYYLRTGFMVTPVNSRYLDRGYSGTHTGAADSDPYFTENTSSYIGNNVLPIIQYERVDMPLKWNGSTMPIYRKRQDWIWSLLWITRRGKESAAKRKTHRAIYKLLVLKKLGKVT